MKVDESLELTGVISQPAGNERHRLLKGDANSRVSNLNKRLVGKKAAHPDRIPWPGSVILSTWHEKEGGERSKL